MNWHRRQLNAVPLTPVNPVWFLELGMFTASGWNASEEIRVELATTLKTHAVRTGVREVGINPNHWYAVGWASDLDPGQALPVTVWNQAIALFRSQAGQLYALEDFCPHRGVSLHKGR